MYQDKQQVANKNNQTKGAKLGSLAHAKQLSRCKLVNETCLKIRNKKRTDGNEGSQVGFKSPRNHHMQIMN